MTRFWEHAAGVATATSATPTEPFECTLEKAQDWCNFVVFRPDWLPPDCHLGKISVRPETARHPSSLRMTVEGKGRSMRLKLFYMDWWLPTASDMNLTAPGTVFVAAGIVGYLGRDYKGQEAACTHRFGALLELSVTEGRFQAEEITAFFENLQPQVPEAVRELGALPFAQISYYARKGPNPGPVKNDLLTGCQWSARREELQTAFQPGQVYYPRQLPASFAFDSVGTRHERSNTHWEYQLLFRHQDNLTDNIWLRAVGEETEKLVWISPGLDHRMGIQLKRVKLKNRTLGVGSTSEPYGERVAQWVEKRIAWEVHARASLHLSEKDFLSFLDSLSPE